MGRPIVSKMNMMAVEAPTYISGLRRVPRDAQHLQRRPDIPFCRTRLASSAGGGVVGMSTLPRL